MNWRLLTETEKRNNKSLRNYRLKLRQKQKRRQAMFQRLGQVLKNPDFLDTVIEPREAFYLQYRTLQKARAMEPLIYLRLCSKKHLGSEGAVCPVDSPHQPVSAPILHRSNRSPIFPWLVPPVRNILPAGMSFTNLRIEAENWKQKAQLDPYAILDRLHSYCGSWVQAADMELWLGLISTPINSDRIADIARARQFWDIWSGGFHHFQTAVKDGLLQPMEGCNWTCFDHAGLIELLPGVRLPRSVRREFYLLRLEGHLLPWDLRLIICSQRGRPLAVHPV